MAKRRLQYEIATGKFTLPVSIILSVMIWTVFFFFKPAVPAEDITSYPFREILSELLSDDWVRYLLTFLGYGLIGYLLIEFNNAYAIIRIRTSLQTSIYCWLILSYPFLFIRSVGCILSLCLGATLYFLFRSYQKTQPVGTVFHAMLFLGLAGLLFPKILLLYPVLLLGTYKFKALTLRTFFAGLIGLSVPYWFLLGHAFYYDRMSLFYAPFVDLTDFLPLFSTQVPLPLILFAAIVVLLLIVSSLHYALTSNEDKIRSRVYLNFLILLGFVIILLGILQMQYALIWLQMLLPLTALLTGHLFALSRTWLSNLFFIFSFIALCSSMCYNLWTLLCSF